MVNSSNSIRPLRQRMVDDMMMRRLSDKMQRSYIRHVRELSEYLGHSPHRAASEELRQYQLHLVKTGVATGSISVNLTGLRFFYEVALGDANRLKRIKRVDQPRKLPEILSAEQVTK